MSDSIVVGEVSGLVDRERGVESKRVEALERRMLRLALDVHDGPMQSLTAVGHSLSGLQRRIEALGPVEDRSVLNTSVEQIMADLVQVEYELRALISALEDGGTESVPLLEAIQTEIRHFKRGSLAEVELFFDGSALAETDSQRIALQTIARAALANVTSHADADNVTIRLHGTADTITLEIVDDGRGFDGTMPAKRGRFGLAGMKRRAELLGGDLEISSRPGGPTAIRATLRRWRPPVGDYAESTKGLQRPERLTAG
jgi:signal transduction histidine kinase